MLLSALLIALKVGFLLVGTFLALPFVLAAITWWRSKEPVWYKTRSALYAGRVWHTRYLPIKHAFQYPLFLFCLELHEEVEQGRLFEEKLWPLSLIVNFSEKDHLKNGEGLSTNATEDNRLSTRITRLVSEKTKGAFTPTHESHSIWIVTHLSYYGYCFNPVSFYYVQNRTTGRTDAVVGEVSNTPWNEMHPYVLHEKSVDDVSVSVLPGKEAVGDDSTSTSSATLLNYVFPKAFHVSPFMEMEYKYDWTFSETFSTSTTTDKASSSSLRIINDMRRSGDDALAFRARMQVERKSMHPFRAAWHVATFPVYCMIIQIWIHYQAFWLFVKGVTFQPHPEGSETTASRVIGKIMVPFFALKDKLSGADKEKRS